MSINMSKPVYSPLRADVNGRYHLLLGCAEGAAALRRVLGELAEDAPAALRRTRVLATGTPVDAFEAFGLEGTHAYDDTAALLTACRSRLEESFMGTRLYIAGPEHFIGRVLQLALQFNLNKDEIRAEALGTLARRVHCVHCRATTEEVRTNIARCTGCARWLLVRDHYSRRFAAYMGVMVDAEAPGELPRIDEIFS